MINKLYVLLAACALWTLARVCRHYEDNLMECNFGENWPWLFFYPVFTIIQIVRYSILPAITGAAFYLLFM